MSAEKGQLISAMSVGRHFLEGIMLTDVRRKETTLVTVAPETYRFIPQMTRRREHLQRKKRIYSWKTCLVDMSKHFFPSMEARTRLSTRG